MIGVGVRIDDVLDRLIRDDLLGFGKDGCRGGFVLRSFDQNNMIFELDSHASVTAGNQVHAFGELPIAYGRGAAATPAAARSPTGSTAAPLSGFGSRSTAWRAGAWRTTATPATATGAGSSTRSAARGRPGSAAATSTTTATTAARWRRRRSGR